MTVLRNKMCYIHRPDLSKESVDDWGWSYVGCKKCPYSYMVYNYLYPWRTLELPVLWVKRVHRKLKAKITS